MRIGDLLAAVPYRTLRGSDAVEVTGFAWDSRQVKPGDVFVAVRGMRTDGHRYISQAGSAGATAVVVERCAVASIPRGLAAFEVDNNREALAWIAAAWNGYPARRLRVVGVTGTDGKTTTVNLAWSVLQAAGHRAGMISTVNARLADRFVDTGLHTTTPDAPAVQDYLRDMAADGLEYVVLESTSHGLAQHRVTGCEYDVAAVTNITHEHLDFHGSPDEYRAAKSMLFTSLASSYRKPGVPKVSVLNRDDSSFDYLSLIPADVTLTYGLSRPADIRAEHVHCDADRSSFDVLTPGGRFPVETPLVGQFNVYNVLAATCIGFSQGAGLDQIRAGIEAVRGILGRMDRVQEGQDFDAIVDFAHTPNALQRALEAVRGTTSGRVIVAFGSAGLRDVEKRELMGRVAGRFADRVILTAEDPRTESLDAIMAAIAEGCEAEGMVDGRDFWRIGDRAEAIQAAIDMAQPGDVVIVAGKGHEKSMCFGTVETPWSDHEAVTAALRRRLGAER